MKGQFIALNLGLPLLSLRLVWLNPNLVKSGRNLDEAKMGHARRTTMAPVYKTTRAIISPKWRHNNRQTIETRTSCGKIFPFCISKEKFGLFKQTSESFLQSQSSGHFRNCNLRAIWLKQGCFNRIARNYVGIVRFCQTKIHYICTLFCSRHIETFSPTL